MVLVIGKQVRAILFKCFACEGIFASQACKQSVWTHSPQLPSQGLGGNSRIAFETHSPHRNVRSIVNCESHLDRRLRGFLSLQLHRRIRMTQIRQGQFDLMPSAMQRDRIFRLAQFGRQFFLRQQLVDLLLRKQSRGCEFDFSQKRKLRQIKCEPQRLWRSAEKAWGRGAVGDFNPHVFEPREMSERPHVALDHLLIEPDSGTGTDFALKCFGRNAAQTDKRNFANHCGARAVHRLDLERDLTFLCTKDRYLNGWRGSPAGLSLKQKKARRGKRRTSLESVDLSILSFEGLPL